LTSVNALADRLGIGDRHLRRLFIQHLGVTPTHMAKTRRLLFAKQLLHQTALPITDIAFAAGFNSLRRFNDVFKTAFHHPPSHERKRKTAPMTSSALTLTLPYRPPYDWEGLLDYYRFRCLDGIETVTDTAYHRTLGTKEAPFHLTVHHDGKKQALIVQLNGAPLADLHAINRTIRRVFDVDCDPEHIHHTLSHDPALAPLVNAHAGVRLPGAWSAFECAVRAVIGQQISVKAARTICMRLVDRVGHGVFPSPDAVANTPLEGLGLTQRRIETLKGLANQWTEPDPSRPTQELIDSLCALKGIGPWTAHYILMRSLSLPDLYPVDDLGLLRALENLDQPHSKKDLRHRAETWHPWQAYGALYLWKAHPL